MLRLDVSLVLLLLAGCGTPSPVTTAGDVVSDELPPRDVVQRDTLTLDEDIADVRAPEVLVSDASAPEVTAIDVSSPDASAIEVSSPDVATPDASAIDASAPDAITPDARGSDVSTTDVTPADASARDVAFDAPDATPGCAPRSRTGASGDRTVAMRFDGRDRSYTMHVPRSYDHTRRTAVVLAFHGAFDDPQGHRDETGFDALADARDLIVVYPEGIGAPTRSWNAGVCCGPAGTLGVDDVGFARAVLDRVEAEYCVDTRRVYAEGFSNGGMLAHLIGCQLSPRIAAIAAVSGVIAASSCAPTRAMPVLHIHGTDDAIVGYDGTLVAGLPSVDETVRRWRDLDRCASTSQTVFTQSPVDCIAYNRCATDSEVRRCRITGGPHHWPAPPWNAAAYILDFFARHPLP
jgi:polyhydroxybutyrate depolymerase